MENSSCENCKLLFRDLENKQKIILDLQADVKKLTELLSIEKNENVFGKVSVQSMEMEKDQNEFCQNEDRNLNGFTICDNSDYVSLESTQTQIVNEECKKPTTKSLRTDENEKGDFNKNEVPENDYVYNEEYKMYYSYSTGYYYDQEKGIFLEPNTRTCYKYDYTNQEYQSVSMEDYISFYKQLDDISCEDMVEQVNGLNLSEKNATTSSNVPASEETALNEDQQPKMIEKKEGNGSADFTTDWQLPDGKSMTVGDLVKEVVEQHCGMSEYVYDESSRMYYCTSTGYYFDPVKQLLYDTSNRISYRYDTDTQSYEYFGEWKSEDSRAPRKSKKQKARKLYWKKKLQQKQSAENSCEDAEKSEGEEEFSSPEEGEIFSSASDSEQPSKDYCPEYEISHKVLSKAHPPCIRVIVEVSETMRAGSLMIVTHGGGIIGREEDSFLHIPDSCISKVHAEIKYDDELKKYVIKDLGSQNGTFINDKRLSQAKEGSGFQAVEHGHRLSLGSCRLLLHIHPGSDTCDGCEPGQLMAQTEGSEKSSIVVKSKEEKEKERRQELQRMKKKYGLKGMDYSSNKSVLISEGYKDRADDRRRVVGSDNPYEKMEEASTDVAMPSSNKGYKMLLNMGWKEGQSLGAENSGIVEPIPLRTWASKAGLGCPGGSPAQSGASGKKSLKWIKARERYYQAS